MRNLDHFNWILAVGVLISRVSCSGPVYFADGPSHVEVILDHSYVIQPPGYWLFNRCAGLFPNAGWGLLGLNWLFSVLGVVVFYNTAKLLVARDLARWAAAAYASIFFLWFSGGVHSSYASQVLFPALCLYLLLRYRESGKLAFLLGASFAFALGAGLRPSDGAFLAPFYVSAALLFGTWKKAILGFVATFVLCAMWLVPTYFAYRMAGFDAGYTPRILGSVSILVHGVTRESMANVARFLVPFLTAFWPILLAVPIAFRRFRSDLEWLLLLWILPGSLFFILVYIADATYLNYLSAGALLLSVLCIQHKRVAIRALLVMLLWNSTVFLIGSPIISRHLAVEIVDCYCLKYTRFAIRHQWAPNLAEVISKGVEATESSKQNRND